MVAAAAIASKVKAYNEDAIYSSLLRNIRYSLTRQGKDIDDAIFLDADALGMATCIVAWNSPAQNESRNIGASG